MARRNPTEFFNLVQETKPRIFALLTAKGKMRPVIIRDELKIDENLCRMALEGLKQEGLVESTGKVYLAKPAPAKARDPIKPILETPIARPVPAYDCPTEKTLALVRVENGKLITDSLMVAEVFGKDHKNVLQAIDSLECSSCFRRLNFQPSNYLNSQGKDHRRVAMTRDGFCFLVMGFTGASAARWKEQFLAAFNAMESALIRGVDELPSLAARLTKVSEELQYSMKNGFGMMNSQISTVDQKVDRQGYRLAEVEKKVETIANRGRRRISPKVKLLHQNAVALMGGYCPCCGTRKIIDNGVAVNAEGDHFYQNSLADEHHTWLICKVCHGELSTGQVHRASRDPEFKAYQSKMRRLPGFQPVLFSA